MNFVLLIYTYFPFGGQQRDMLRICQEMLNRGHSVEVFTMSWQGDIPDGLTITTVPKKSISRLKRYKQFTQWVADELSTRQNFHTVGFAKMPNLDTYFAADPCFLEKADTQRGWYYKYTTRYRHFAAYEKAIFESSSQTEVLILTPSQGAVFESYYPDCGARLHELPAGISEDRKVECREPAKGQSIRDELGIDKQTKLILQIGSGFKVKGVDRSLRAIAALPASTRSNCHYLLVGEDRSKRFSKLAKKLGISSIVTILAGRDDIPEILQAADMMLHPAYSESAGYVLLEATIAGLPVLTTASCGYAYHIEKAKSGDVCSLPFVQTQLNSKLESMLSGLDSEPWSENGLSYGRNDGLYSMPSAAVDYIEAFAAKRGAK